MKKSVLIYSVVAFLSLILSLNATALDEKKTIRVAILKKAKIITISISGRYQILSKDNQLLKKSRSLKNTNISVTNSGFQVGDEFFASKTIRLLPNKYFSIKIKDKFRKYRGAVDLVIDKEETFTAINVIDLEDYVKGVLYHEADYRWPMHALMAQAVAVRSYAMYQMQTNKKLLYDVTNDIYSQVYGGKSSEKYRTNIASKKTKRQYLEYNDEVLPAYFHSNSGGHTEDVSEMWNHDLAPLKGKNDKYSKGQPSYSWKRNFRLQDIQKKLNAKGYKLDLIKEIKVVEKTASGRNKRLKITTRSGKKVVIPGKKFRQIVSPNVIRSNKYEIVMQGYYVDFIGHGWGHGVGLSQWGAYAMSKLRFKYREILQYYYPETEIKRY